MPASKRIRWHCPNRDCNWTQVAAAQEEAVEPECACGRRMKREELVPVFQYLDFLTEDAADGKEVGTDKE